MRIAMISPALLPVPAVRGGAVESLMQLLIDENEKEGLHRFIIYSYFDESAYKESLKYKYTEFIYIRRKSIKYIICGLFYKAKRFWVKSCNEGAYTQLIVNDLKKQQVDRIIIQGNVELILPISKGIKRKDLYLHLHSDGMNSELDKNIDKYCIKESLNRVICVSDFIKNQTKANVDFKANEITVVKNCIDINKFENVNPIDRTSLRKKFNINEQDIVIIFTGRILPIKGIKELIQAFKKISSEIDIKLLIVGNAGFGNKIVTEYDNELFELTRDIQDKIIFTGFIHNNQIPEIHAISDIAVVPSIWDEPAGLVVIEAMASGLPLIVTDSGGISEYITSEGSITIKRDKNLINNMANAIEKLSLDQCLREKMGNINKVYVKQFNKEKFLEEFLRSLNDF